MNTITIIKPDDWHCHLRDGVYLKRTVNDTARCFARAIVMPNLHPPVTQVEHAQAYRQRIMQNCHPKSDFNPLMTLYLTDNTKPTDIKAAKASGIVHACKLYPQHATTLSQHGVSDIKKLYPIFASMQQEKMVLCIHGEVTDKAVDIFAREKVFIEAVLTDIIKNFPELKIVLEHISTATAADFVLAQGDFVAATITPHHLMINRNHMLGGGIKPHLYCMPIVKTMADQAALIKAAVSGNRKFFLGTDSAPHKQSTKETACGCAGIYSAHAAIEFYAEVFEQANALDKLENFASVFGANFYALPVNKTTITLEKNPWQIPPTLNFGDENLIPFQAGETCKWCMAVSCKDAVLRC